MNLKLFSLALVIILMTSVLFSAPPPPEGPWSTLGGMIMVDSDHECTHNGHVSRLFLTETLANGASFTLALVVPVSSLTFALRPDIDSTAALGVQLIESSGTVSSGTAQALPNANRTSGVISTLTALRNPFYTLATSTTLAFFTLGAGKKQGGSADAQYEWILRPGSNYLIRGINTSGGESVVNLRLALSEYDHLVEP